MVNFPLLCAVYLSFLMESFCAKELKEMQINSKAENNEMVVFKIIELKLIYGFSNGN